MPTRRVALVKARQRPKSTWFSRHWRRRQHVEQVGHAQRKQVDRRHREKNGAPTCWHSRGQAKVAIEIQWSGQTGQEIVVRQERYRESGVRGLWLFRRRGLRVPKDLPAAWVTGTVVAGFETELNGQTLPLSEFLDAVFARRLRYGIPLGAKAVVRIQSGETGCSKCEEATWIVTLIEVSVGSHRFQLRVPDLTDFPDLLASCLEHVPRGSGVGRIKPRYSSAPRIYMSNGCCHCDALINYARCENDVLLAQFPIIISDRWQQAIDPHNERGWGVFAFE